MLMTLFNYKYIILNMRLDWIIIVSFDDHYN